ncbi:beta-lactamase family protein [Nocardioides sp. zg-1308]|uniref:serine hydrolase domain-containing protein n=1 Tax=Nocardioides sp. zg-1308 TaxID=2736253 RepID=UPI001553F64C|nr:serine hydrolase domain-containing protein [Nocardioides sp. zg-1308]NPD05662.1 beta-lactamase family protein [Nocardioides sp. zg-1308]
MFRRMSRTTAVALTVSAVAVSVTSNVVAAKAAPAPDGAGHHAATSTQERLDRLVSRTGFPGVIATVRGADGKVRTWTAGSGDLATGAPVPEDSRVRIASNTKMFTATVVLQLVGEGLVELDAPVERYLPGVVRGGGNDGRRITVRQLLQQTSGLPDYDSLVIEAGGSLSAVAHTYFEPHDLLDAALAEGRDFRPGTRWAYSNTNYVVLGLLVQRVTGRPVGEEIAHRIIEPLGLRDTYWPRAGEQRIRGSHPHGYLAAEPGAPGAPWEDITRMDPSLGWAAGQLVSTPADLGAFMGALVGGELLEPAQLDAMQQTVRAPGFDAEPGWRYGLGLASQQLDCGVVGWGHGGDIQGFETRNLVASDGRWAVVAVTALPTSMEMLADVSGTVEDLVCGA